MQATKILLLTVLGVVIVGTVAGIVRFNSEDLEEYRRVEVLKSNKQGDPDVETGLEDESNIEDVVEVLTTTEDVATGTKDDIENNVDEDLSESEPEIGLILTTGSWVWRETQYGDEDVITPHKSDSFVIQFKSDGNFHSSTDCNSVSGEYKIDGTTLLFGEMMMTLMGCLEETQETEYLKMLSSVDSFDIDADEVLMLQINEGKGVMSFTQK